MPGELSPASASPSRSASVSASPLRARAMSAETSPPSCAATSVKDTARKRKSTAAPAKRSGSRSPDRGDSLEFRHLSGANCLDMGVDGRPEKGGGCGAVDTHLHQVARLEWSFRYDDGLVAVGASHPLRVGALAGPLDQNRRGGTDFFTISFIRDCSLQGDDFFEAPVFHVFRHVVAHIPCAGVLPRRVLERECAVETDALH